MNFTPPLNWTVDNTSSTGVDLNLHTTSDNMPEAVLESEDVFSEFDFDLKSEDRPATRKQIKELKMLMYDAAQMLLRQVRDVTLPDPSKYITSDKWALVAFLTDDHLGKKCFAPNTNEAVYSFNLLIAKNRLDYYFDKMIEKYMERPDRYDLIVLNLGGDHIEGDGSIYASQAFELETGINQQMIAFQEILMKNVKRLSMLIEQNNGHIMIKAVPGNHGENRKDFMTNPTSNFDYIMYMQIEYMLKIQKESGLMTNVSIEMPNPIMVDRKFVKYNIKGWNFHLEHIFQNNFITPSGQAKIRNLDEIADGVDVILTGHLHQEVMATIGKTTIIRSPALTGYDDYAHTLKAPMSESMHPILVTTPQQKIKEYLPISLGKII